MGLFSNKKKTQVGTTVSRVIADDTLPNSIKSGVLKSIMNGGDISDYIMEDMISSIGVRAERMYEYANTTYTHGLPSGEVRTATQGKSQAATVLSVIEGSTVLVDYCYFGPPNNLHIGWLKLRDLHGYDHATNQLGVLATTMGKPVYLKDMVVVVPADMLDLIEVGSLDQWGTPATAGFTPQRLANTGLLGALSSPSPVHADPLATEEHLLVTYVWKSAGTVMIGEESHAGIVINQASFTIPVTGYVEEADYFHVKYSVGGVIKYWMYEAGSGTYPTLDAVFNSPVAITGTYFPFAYFRFNKVSEISDKTTESYRTSKRLVKYLGMDYDMVAEGIEENPGIADVEQAMMIMAVPANTEDPMERRYLFQYFDSLYGLGDNQFKSPTQASIIRRQTDAQDLTKATIIIEDARFKMALSNGGIYKKLVPGSIGPMGSYGSGFTASSVDQPYVDADTLEPMVHAVVVSYHFYRHQITETMYEEIQVVNLKMLYYIFEGYTTTGDEEDDILLIPIDRSITESYSIPDREILFSRSLHYVFNSRVITTVKWYQTGVFQVILLIIAIIITIFTWGADGGSSIGAALGLTGTASLVATVVITLVIGQLIAKAFTLFVKVFGKDAATIVAIIAILYGGYQVVQSGSVAGAPWAQELLQIANGLSSAVMQARYDDLLDVGKQFDLLMDTQTKELEKAQKLLEGNNFLSPFVVFGETPSEYYDRTVHSGNIGVLGISAIALYVDIALTLPKLNNSLKGT